MKQVDWEAFCQLRSVGYTRTAASAARGYINVHCPMCSASDSGHHMGLHWSGRWSCFRDPISHRGTDPRRIIMLLIGCSYEEASSYVQEGGVDVSDFEQAAVAFLESEQPREQTSVVGGISWPPEFRKLRSPRGRARLYWEYLKSRGFGEEEAAKLVRRYDVHYCDKGRWLGRVILPIYVHGQLVSWVGRTVYPTETLRYLSLTHNPEQKLHGVVNVRDVLFNYDRAARGNYQVCVLVEGPMDAIRVDYVGHRYGVRSVATFGLSLRDGQLDMLHHIRRHCNRLVVCGDEWAEGNVLDVLSASADLHLRSVELPPGVGDPAELTRRQIRDLFARD